MFFVGVNAGPGKSLLAAVMLTGVILLGVVMTFWVSRLLSATILKGVPSSFTLELPPYRRPRIGQVVVRSVLDRTLFVLGRAAAVAAPAGLLIWLCANVQVGGDSILNWCTGFLDPFARLLGLEATSVRQSALNLIRTARRYVEQLNIPSSIQAAGVDKAEFEAEAETMAEAALADRCTATNPRLCSKEEILQVFHKAYIGRLP